ncbi:hypothetical protein C7S20_07215 [Christiangramia fulva]|uniref:Putative beta-lactamase-inhibitor-like PepSY-like domain-containing protein n=1 Tax=Christiangramia fulva TaxID=2126553 RepID=A0A2R3Z480_9FLAO|nr:PepSY-like domain-containing protein [Christiangramia fulva]AVR45075.1 hypothetical protein C7S20_07215 [Christiangramia fulva]
MRKLFNISLIFMAFTVISCAQKGDVSQSVKKAFNQKFPDAKKVSWDQENSHEWEAEFTRNGLEYSANYSVNGEWLETESEIESAEVPAQVSQNMTKDYPDARIKEVFKVERKDGVFYEYEFKLNGKTQEALYDSSGNKVENQKSAEEDEEYEKEDDD